jgi:tRNA-dihydrouridine synthase
MKVLPAPLAGYTDFAFRRLLAECGADEVWTEMISAAALVKNNPKTVGMIKTVAGVRNVAQLFGCDSEYFAAAVAGGALAEFDEININMGCPAPKVAKEGGGGTLMRNVTAAKKIITACKKALTENADFAANAVRNDAAVPAVPAVPAVFTARRPNARAPQKLSVKMRLGWNKNTAVPFARMCEECGADRIIVHGRFGTDGYSGVADWAAVAEVVRAVKIPVIANGDITDIDSAKRCLAVTNADGVMIGRGLLGHPWRIALNGQTPTDGEIKRIIARHIELFEAEKYPFPEFKKHALFYCNALKVGKEIKRSVAVTKDMDEIKRLLCIGG